MCASTKRFIFWSFSTLLVIGRMRAPEAHDLRFSFDSLLSELLVLAGEGERALTLAGDALNNWDSLRTPWLARLYHLLGNPQLERYHLIASSAMAVEFLLDTAGDQAENYLAQRQPGLALECAETALRFIPLLCGRETDLPPLHDRDTGNLMQQAARACLGLGRREEALGWLLRMCDYELEVHLAGQAKSVETALFRHSIRPEPAGGRLPPLPSEAPSPVSGPPGPGATSRRAGVPIPPGTGGGHCRGIKNAHDPIRQSRIVSL